MMRTPAVFIVGQTATGKTDLALHVASIFPSVLISADSRQVYKGMDIGTGKDIPKHTTVHLQNEVYPHEEWSASHFVRAATPLCTHAWETHHFPIYVGGTGMYIESLFGTYASLHVGQNSELRKTLASHSVQELQEKLRRINPDRFERMNNSDRNNPRRLVRAIEVGTIQPHISPLIQKNDTLWIGLTLPFSTLEQRIQARVHARMQNGMIEETRTLMHKYTDWTLPAFSATGYREVRAYLENKITQEECRKLWTLHELQYAKRQLTWFKKQSHIQWFDAQLSTLHTDVEKYVKSWYDETYAAH